MFGVFVLFFKLCDLGFNLCFVVVNKFGMFVKDCGKMFFVVMKVFEIVGEDIFVN